MQSIMASTTTSALKGSKDTTFLNFTPEQAATYSKHRGSSYPQSLYQAILDFHQTGHDLMYDVGTGPGKVVFDFLAHFKRGLGSDTGVQMIEQAKKDAATRGFSERTRFFVAGGEDCAEPLTAEEVGRVDLMTAAMAAHWFRLPEFYASAAKALRPGGTLAVWTCSSFYVHTSDPKAKEIQEVLSWFEDEVLGPYMTDGNRLSRAGYKGMGMPWDEEATKKLFPKGDFKRIDWDIDGKPSAPALKDGTPGPYQRMDEADIDGFEEGFGAASAVVRWKQANPDKVGTDQDPLRIMVNKLRNILGDRTKFLTGSSTSLLLFRRSKE